MAACTHLKLPAPHILNPSSEETAGSFSNVPRSPGIYKLELAGSPPHIAQCANLQRRLSRLLTKKESNGTALPDQLRRRITSISFWQTGSKLETAIFTYAAVKECFPRDYIRRLRMRLPWFVRLADSQGFGRLTITNKAFGNEGLQLGPFHTRDAAEAYENAVTHLFQLRRCTESLQPAPEHPGCVFGEMNQCLRPCQCAVTMEEYRTEQDRAIQFLNTNGREAISTLTTARDRAAEQMEFEHAAFLHKRIEKIKAAASLKSEVVENAHRLTGLALTPSCGSNAVRLWPMLNGYWQEPLDIQVPGAATAGRSLDSELRSRLAAALANPRRGEDRTEELAIFSRWYHSTWRDGDWFPFRAVPDLDYRRLVRGISKLAKDSAP